MVKNVYLRDETLVILVERGAVNWKELRILRTKNAVVQCHDFLMGMKLFTYLFFDLKHSYYDFFDCIFFWACCILFSKIKFLITDNSIISQFITRCDCNSLQSLIDDTSLRSKSNKILSSWTKEPTDFSSKRPRQRGTAWKRFFRSSL